jgi:hypothetical protein
MDGSFSQSGKQVTKQIVNGMIKGEYQRQNTGGRTQKRGGLSLCKEPLAINSPVKEL